MRYLADGVTCGMHPIAKPFGIPAGRAIVDWRELIKMAGGSYTAALHDVTETTRCQKSRVFDSRVTPR